MTPTIRRLVPPPVRLVSRFNGRTGVFRSLHPGTKRTPAKFLVVFFVIAILIINVKMQFNLTEKAFMRRLSQAADQVGDWFFRPRPFYGASKRLYRVSEITRTIEQGINNRLQHVQSADASPQSKNVKNDVEDADLEDEGDGSTSTYQNSNVPKDGTAVSHRSESESKNGTLPQLTSYRSSLSAQERTKIPKESSKHPLDGHVNNDEDESEEAGSSFSAPRVLYDRGTQNLPVPKECSLWRSIALDPSRLHLYRKHFTSLDFSDWYLFVSMFTEAWQKSRKNAAKRPVYVDVAANHAKRWSNTWFFDRCMGWDGVCVEANDKYHDELRTQRHCALVDTCVSDIERNVNFSFTNAYGGVVRGQNSLDWGVDGHWHATALKFEKEFRGIRTLRCTTLQKEFVRLGVKHVDFMSLDVEGYELPVLHGINFKKVTIDVLVIENRRPEIEIFLSSQGYTVYTGIMKDHVYIRNKSPYSINTKYANWIKTIGRTDFRFHLNL